MKIYKYIYILLAGLPRIGVNWGKKCHTQYSVNICNLCRFLYETKCTLSMSNTRKTNCPITLLVYGYTRFIFPPSRLFTNLVLTQGRYRNIFISQSCVSHGAEPTFSPKYKIWFIKGPTGRDHPTKSE